MGDATALFRPTVETRDVLESFLANQIVVDDWAEILRSASERFSELGYHWSDLELTQLARSLNVLASRGLDQESELTESVAADIATLLDNVATLGIPGPDSDSWRF